MVINFNKLESLLIESCQAGTFITNLSGKLIECNPAFVKMFGYQSKEEILSANAVNFYASSKEREKYLEILHSQGKVRGYKVVANKFDGSTVYHSINSDFYKTDDGENYIIGSTIDITEIEKFGHELNESNKKYEDLIENSLEIIQSFDENGQLVFCNKIWHEKLEYSKEEIKNLNLFDIISSEDHEHCKKLFAEVLSGKSLKDVEVNFISKSGKKYLLEGNVVPLEQNGKLISTHAFFRDTTEKKKAVQKIIEQEKLLQTIFNTVPICLYLKSSNGQYLHTNDMMVKTLGYSVTGKFDNEIFPATACSLLNTTDTEALNNPNKIVRFELEGEFGGKKKVFFAGKQALYNESNQDYDIFGFSLDITDLNNSLKKAEESEKILQFIIDNSQGGFLLFNFDSEKQEFEIEFANSFARDLLKIEGSKNSLNEIFQFLEIDFFNSDFFRFQGEELRKVFDWEFKAGNGSPSKNFSIRFTRMSQDSLEKKRLIVYLIDVTEQQKLINELEIQLNENLVLIGEIHHRVKNNLAVIDGLLQLKKAQSQDKILNDNITDIQMRIKSIALVHQKLYQSSIFDAINLKDYVPELSLFYKKIFHKDEVKEVDFEIYCQDDIFLSISKAVTFGLLLSELISNSCKYGLIESNLSIKIDLEQKENRLCISYSDNGRGLPSGIKHLKHGGFGFRLMDNLLRQLKGKHELILGSGFKFNFEFLL